MAAQVGKELLLKRGDAASPEVFTTVAGGRTDGLAFNKNTIDITNKGSVNQWRELLAGGGVKSAVISTSGIFLDGASDESIRADYYGSILHNYQLLVPDFGTFTGAFVITSLDYTGETEDGVNFSATFDSAGEIIFASV